MEMLRVMFFFFKQKTAYEMRISDWSSDVCSSDLLDPQLQFDGKPGEAMPVGDISADGADIAQNDGEDPEAATPVDAGAEAGTDETGAGAPENDNDENADDGARDTTDSTEDAEPDASHTDALDANNPETAAADGDADPSTDPSQDDTNTDALAAEGDSTRSMQ